MANQVLLSVEYIPNPTIGKALSLADIYVGIVDLDPKIVGNQKQISVLQENGTTVQVSQPISTSAGGVPLYNGSPVTILVDGSYSLRIDDSSGSQVYYVPKNAELESLDSLDNIADLLAIAETPIEGATFLILGYYNPGDGGGQIVYWDAISEETSNGGSIFKATNIEIGRFKSTETNATLVERFGAIPEDAPNYTIDQSAYIQSALSAGFGTVKFGDGYFNVDASRKHLGNSREGMNILSNTKIVMSPATVITMTTSLFDQYNIFLIDRQNNIQIYNGALVGDADTHVSPTPGTPYYNGLGIRIVGSSNVDIYNMSATKFWADGMVTVYYTGIPSTECVNVNFYNCIMNYNNRNGLSIIGCVGGSVVGGEYRFNALTPPMAGIDVEPNSVKPDGDPSVVRNFSITGILSSGNGKDGIVLDAAGTIEDVVVSNNHVTDNTNTGIVANDVDGLVLTGNTVTGNVASDILVLTCLNVIETNNVQTYNKLTPQGLDAVSSRSKKLQMELSGIYGGVKIPHTAEIGVGIYPFAMSIKVGLDDWTPTTEKVLYLKLSGTAPNQTGIVVRLHPLGNIYFDLYRNDAGTTVSSTLFNPGISGEILDITWVVTRETTTVDGNIELYFNGTINDTIVIPLSASVGGDTLSDTGVVYLNGTDLITNSGTFNGFTQWNGLLSAAGVMEFYKNGVAVSDKWGSNSPLSFGCNLSLISSNIQNTRGQWLDETDNKNHAKLPILETTVANGDNIFTLRGVTEWTNTSEAQDVCGFTENVLPENFYIDSIIGVVSGVNIQDVQCTDGATPEYFVADTVGLIAGTKTFTIATPYGDGVNYIFNVLPDSLCTMSISWTVKGHILD